VGYSLVVRLLALFVNAKVSVRSPVLVVDGVHGPCHGGPLLPGRISKERHLAVAFAESRKGNAEKPHVSCGGVSCRGWPTAERLDLAGVVSWHRAG